MSEVLHVHLRHYKKKSQVLGGCRKEVCFIIIDVAFSEHLSLVT